TPSPRRRMTPSRATRHERRARFPVLGPGQRGQPYVAVALDDAPRPPAVDRLSGERDLVGSGAPHATILPRAARSGEPSQPVIVPRAARNAVAAFVARARSPSGPATC